MSVQGRVPTYNDDLWGTKTTEAGSWSRTFTPDQGFGHRAVDSLQTLGKSLSSSHKPRVSDHTSFQNNVSVRKYHCCSAGQKRMLTPACHHADSLSPTGSSSPVPCGWSSAFCLLLTPVLHPWSSVKWVLTDNNPRQHCSSQASSPFRDSSLTLKQVGV